MPLASVLAPVGFSAGPCGYCTPHSSSSDDAADDGDGYKFGMWALQLTPHVYGALAGGNPQEGWGGSNFRRSGKYLYRPDNSHACCPLLTIRLDAQQYSPGRAQRRALARFCRFIRGQNAPPSKTKGKYAEYFDLFKRWYAIESPQDAEIKENIQPPMARSNERLYDTSPTLMRRRLQTRLVPAGFTMEKFTLYQKYQMVVHKDKKEDLTRDGFTRFLVDTPIIRTDPATGDVPNKQADVGEVYWGSYHQEYRLDGKLIAVGVLDILPTCVSSVYLYYDPGYSDLKLGTIAAMREALLVRELRARGGPWAKMQYYLLGYYVHTCTKMRYKADYRPSELLDQQDGTWHRTEDLMPAFDSDVVYGWRNPAPRPGPKQSPTRGPFLPFPPPAGFGDPRSIAQDPGLLANIKCMELASKTCLNLLQLVMHVRLSGTDLFAPTAEDDNVWEEEGDEEGDLRKPTHKVLDMVAALGPLATQVLIALV